MILYKFIFISLFSSYFYNKANCLTGFVLFFHLFILFQNAEEKPKQRKRQKHHKSSFARIFKLVFRQNKIIPIDMSLTCFTGKNMRTKYMNNYVLIENKWNEKNLSRLFLQKLQEAFVLYSISVSIIFLSACKWKIHYNSVSLTKKICWIE